MLCQQEQSRDCVGNAHYNGQQQWQPRHQCIYFLHMNGGDGFTVYWWIRSAFMINNCAREQLWLTLAVRCKWEKAQVVYSHPWRRSCSRRICRHSHHLHSDQEKALPSLWASPWEGFAFPMGHRHWGLWHSCAHVYSSRSLMISWALYTFLLP